MRKLRVEGKDKERIVWREILRSGESRYDHRLHGILAVCRGLSCYEAAAIWGRSPRAVEYWVKRFSNDGVKGLKEKRRPGRPSALTAAQLKMLSSDLRRGPQVAGHAERRWSGKLLKVHLQESYEVTVGLRQTQRLLRRWEGGVSPKIRK